MKLNRILTGIVIGCLMLGSNALAANAAGALEVKQNNNTISIYTNEISGKPESMEAYIGKESCEKIDYEQVAQTETLILIDNSLSIPDSSRAGVRSIVEEIAASRNNGDSFAVATFDEHVTYLLDYTTDYGKIRDAVEGIEFKNQETYLTDVLYEIISDGFNSDSVFRKILVISDGVDNKSIGYTKDELQTLLSSNPVPIYSIGVYNKKKTNSNELENMFSLCRSTGGEYCLLEDAAGFDQVVNSRNIGCFYVTPAQSSIDGSEKTVTIEAVTGGKNVTISADHVRMGVAPAKSETAPKKEQSGKETGKETGAEQSANLSAKDRILNLVRQYRIPFIAGISVLILLLILLLIKLTRKPKPVEPKPVYTPPIPGDDDKTVVIRPANPTPTGDETVRIVPRNTVYRICLSDVGNPAQKWERPIENEIRIGKSNANDICITYDTAISRQHCTITRRGDKFYLGDKGSTNGTILNNRRVLGEVELVSGSVIQLGTHKFRLDITRR